MRRGVVQVLVALVVLAGGISATPASSAAVSPSPCNELALSPDFAHDGTAFCAGVVYNPSTGEAVRPVVFVTTDKGHSWKAATAAGLAVKPSEAVLGLVVSPGYPTDHMVFVQLNRSGVFASSDRGETFTPVTPLGYGRLTPYVAGPAAAPALARPMLLHANVLGIDDVSMQLDPVVHAPVPVAGSPGSDREFALSPRYATDGLAFMAALVVSADRSEGWPTVFACATGFTCAEKRFEGPEGAVFDRIWAMPASTPSGFVVVVRLLVGYEQRTWWLTDGGQTFRPWDSVNAIAATLAVSGGALTVTPDPTSPRRMYLRVSWSSSGGRTPPDEQVFVSTDGGAHWTRVAYGTWDGPRRRHVGAVPETGYVGNRVTPAGHLLAGGGGRLFMLAGWERSPGYAGPLCSRDGGRTWARLC